MKNNLIYLALSLLLVNCGYPKEDPIKPKIVHGMQVGTDSMLLGGKIFYVDSINGYCLLALVSEDTQFKEDCQFPCWSPYYYFNGVETCRLLQGLTDTILGGKANTDIIYREYGCNTNSDCNFGNGFYSAKCVKDLKISVYDSVECVTHIYHDYWVANLREAMIYSNNIGGCDWFATSSQADRNNYYTVNCRDKRTITEPKSQKRLPLVIRKHSFNE